MRAQLRLHQFLMLRLFSVEHSQTFLQRDDNHEPWRCFNVCLSPTSCLLLLNAPLLAARYATRSLSHARSVLQVSLRPYSVFFCCPAGSLSGLRVLTLDAKSAMSCGAHTVECAVLRGFTLLLVCSTNFSASHAVLRLG